MTRSRSAAVRSGVTLALLAALSACSPATGTAPTSPDEEPLLQWPSPPPLQIESSKSYQAVFTTEMGEFTVRLFADQAPRTVNNFVFLARQGYYDNTTFHRVLPGFMAQGGDPSGTGAGGPGYEFEDEFDADLQFDRPGLLAMANRGPDTNGGQFFITYAPTPHLNGFHTIFGEVLEGADVVGALTPRDPQANPDHQGTRLLSVEILESDG
jgi:cyclophilin family peptidyl-prolyl cis-trans isomerase